MSRPGFVLEVDRSTPPILFHHGEGFRLEKLPAGSRVVYPAEPIAPLADPEAAIRHALLNPVGDSQPLPSLLYAGMKLTIAMDNQAVPLPPASTTSSWSSPTASTGARPRPSCATCWATASTTRSPPTAC